MRSPILSSLKRGFTLIEILIVVVILGILAAIVIPQFTDASEDAQTSSVQSQLQTIRGQIELFNVQTTAYPTFAGGVWDELTTGNYLQSAPRNAMRNNATAVLLDAGPVVVGAASGGAATDGWVWDQSENIMFAIDPAGDVLDW